MPKITINQKEYVYDESEVITFAEGLIGLPEMRRAVLLPLEGFEPFCWLASVDDERKRFVVVNPYEIFDDYKPRLPVEPDGELAAEKDLRVFSIVKISSDWRQTTVNLRAPLFVNRKARRGAQFVLADTVYSLAEAFPQN